MKIKIENRVNFFGTYISVINQEKQLIKIDSLIHDNKTSYITYSNVHVVVTSKKNEALRKAINSAAIASPDGMPLVKLARWKKATEMERCSGPDMFTSIIEHGLERGYQHYFYGSTEETLEMLQTSLKDKYPEIKIVGALSPPFRELSDEEDKAIMDEINRLNPDCIWVGLGAPKQELWMNSHKDKINRGIMFGVGAAFDFHAGTIKRAPVWMQKNSLEWFYRLIKEPTRLWRRYFVTNALFIYYCLMHGIELTKYSFENENAANVEAVEL